MTSARGWVVRVVRRWTGANGHLNRSVGWWGVRFASNSLPSADVRVFPTKAEALSALRDHYGTVPAASRHGLTVQRYVDAQDEWERLQFKAASES